MRRFHRTRPAAAGHQEFLAAERRRDARDAAVNLRPPRLVMAAHDGGDARPFFEQGEHRLRD